MASRGPATYLACAFALAAGIAIAWMDTRPAWDDTGITAGALLVASGLAAVLGAPPWLAALLVVGPLEVAEWSGTGVGLILPVLIVVIGAGVGALLRRRASRPSAS